MENLSSSVSGPGPKLESVAKAAPVTALPAPDRRRPPTLVSPHAATHDIDENTFLELRRKVQAGELLSASIERLLGKMKFNGHLTVVVQHGRVVKTGYEEGYFRRNNDLGGMLPETS